MYYEVAYDRTIVAFWCVNWKTYTIPIPKTEFNFKGVFMKRAARPYFEEPDSNSFGIRAYIEEPESDSFGIRAFIEKS